MMSKYEQEETAFKEFFNEKQQALLQAKGAVTMTERYDIVVNAASTGQFRKFFLKERLESLLDDDWFYLNKVHADKKLIERVNKHYHQCRGEINKMYKL